MGWVNAWSTQEDSFLERRVSVWVHVSPQPEQNPLDHSRALWHPAIVTFTHYPAVMDSVQLMSDCEWDRGTLNVGVCVCTCCSISFLLALWNLTAEFVKMYLQYVFAFAIAFGATCISIWVHGALQSAGLIETQWRGKAREKVIDCSQHKGPQETAGREMVNE